MTMPEITPQTLHVCSICQKPFTGFGNNAYPINNGRCCNWCNDTVVIPARIIQMRSPKKEEN